MAHSRSIITTILCLAALLVVLRITARWAVEEVVEPQPLAATGGRLQLVLDEQDVGLVQTGQTLEVPFAVGNTGNEKLVLRQAPRECCSDAPPPSTIVIEPGQVGEITAVLSATDLLGRGRKHIRFFTSDTTSPELWVTVRGTLVRPASRNGATERSVLINRP